MDAPAEHDRYEIAFDKFDEQLSFTIQPCETYGDLTEIGSTVIRNGIAVTATAERRENELIVWYYETRDINATLHIPFLGMRRDEEIKTMLTLPGELGTFESDVVMETSLGKIHIETIKRSTKEEKVLIELCFRFENSSEEKRISAFSLTNMNPGSVWKADGILRN